MSLASTQPHGVIRNLNVSEFSPGNALAGYIARYFSVVADAGTMPTTIRAVPDGCVDIIFNLGDTMPGAYVGGPRTAAGVYTHYGPTCFIGAQLLPGIARLFLQKPIDTLKGDWIALDVFLGSAANDFVEDLKRSPSIEMQISRLDKFFGERLHGKCIEPRVARCVDLLMRSGGMTSIDELSRESATSTRNLGRLFGEWIGMSPKRFARVIRFQGLLDRISRNQLIDWAELAAALGYADQSHLIRDVAAFAGVVPSELMRQTMSFTAIKESSS